MITEDLGHIKRIAYAARVQAQEWLAQRLDSMCYDLGLSPTIAWRIPHADAEIAEGRMSVQHLREALALSTGTL